MKTRTFVSALAVSVALSVFITYYITKSSASDYNGNAPVSGNIMAAPISVVSNTGDGSCGVNFFREKNFKFIKPILFAESYAESPELSSLKSILIDKIKTMEQAGTVTRAAVYFKELSSTKWTEVNGFEKFYPGSMLKVSIMINILKQAESNPSILDKELVVRGNMPLKQTFLPPNPLHIGQTYTVKQLVRAMIVNSDNDATQLLFTLLDGPAYKKLFVDLGMEEPDLEDWNYSLSAPEFARFYRILYNASFLNRTDSELALSLLSQSVYKDGLLKYLPENMMVSHKFGERNTETNLQQFHESGIVYAGNKPYIVVVMTEGKKLEELPEVVAQLSLICQNYIAKKGS